MAHELQNGFYIYKQLKNQKQNKHPYVIYPCNKISLILSKSIHLKTIIHWGTKNYEFLFLHFTVFLSIPVFQLASAVATWPSLLIAVPNLFYYQIIKLIDLWAK